MIKLVLYDADGVLVHTELAVIELARKYDISREQTRQFFKKEWDQLLIGNGDTKEKLAPYLAKWGWKGTVEDYQKFWFEFEHKIDQNIIDHIQGLRSRGIICAVATNQDTYRAKYMLEKMGFSDSFDALYASAGLGIAKPHINFFKLILQKYKFLPNEILFWDDKIENVESARSLGMYAEMYVSFDDYKTKMKELIT